MFEVAADRRVSLSSFGLLYGKARRRAQQAITAGVGRRYVTGIEDNPWITIDLGGSVDVATVACSFADDADAAVAARLEVLGSDDMMAWARGIPAPGEPRQARWSLGIAARFVQFRLRGHGQIALESMRVSALRPTVAFFDTISTSLTGHDVWVAQVHAMRRDGYFVEIGAADGRGLSNCWALETYLGWRGICVEANPVVIEDLRRNRPNAIVEHKAMGARSGEIVEFVSDGYYGTLKGLANKAQIETKPVVQVETLSLNDLLDRHAAPPVIDFLSIDTEGSEPDIIAGFDFNRRRVLIWCVEHSRMGRRKPELAALFAAQGYGLIDTGIDWLAVHGTIAAAGLPPHMNDVALRGAAPAR